MAKRKARGTFSHSGTVGLDFYGFDELLRKIVDAGGKLEDALVESLKASSEPIGADLLLFMAKHHRTGDTAASFTDVVDVEKTGGYIWYKLGFDIKKGGLPALFLDIGTPTITPSFFVYYAFENNMDRVVQAQEHALKKVLKELM